MLLCRPLQSKDTSAAPKNAEGQIEQRRTGDANLGKDGTNIDDSGPDKALRSPVGPSATSVPEAIAAIMDTPHPLDILGEPGSYGFTVSPPQALDPNTSTV